jgi:flagellar basal-body rod protein FlgB
MYPALWIAKTGRDAEQTRMSVIANNLANVNTTGFKRDRAVFEDLMYQNIRQTGANSTEDTTLPSGLQVGTGVRTVATQKLHTQGNIVQTGNSFDVAVQGSVFFGATPKEAPQKSTPKHPPQKDTHPPQKDTHFLATPKDDPKRRTTPKDPKRDDPKTPGQPQKDNPKRTPIFSTPKGQGDPKETLKRP